MELIADILLAGGALGAGIYCFVLSRKLNRFSRLDQGVGGAIAVLSVQVDDLTKALEKAQGAARESAGSLEGLTVRAEQVEKRLELMMAAMHDIPGEGARRDTRRVRVRRQRMPRAAAMGE